MKRPNLATPLTTIKGVQAIINNMPSRVQNVLISHAERTGLTPELIVSDVMKVYCVEARWAVWHEVYYMAWPNGRKPSWSKVGRWFGRSHATIRCGVMAWEAQGCVNRRSTLICNHGHERLRKDLIAGRSECRACAKLENPGRAIRARAQRARRRAA